MYISTLGAKACLHVSVKVIKVKAEVIFAAHPPSPFLRRFQFTYGGEGERGGRLPLRRRSEG